MSKYIAVWRDARGVEIPMETVEKTPEKAWESISEDYDPENVTIYEATPHAKVKLLDKPYELIPVDTTKER